MKNENPALNALRHHVTGAIERGEAQAIVEKRLPKKETQKINFNLFRNPKLARAVVKQFGDDEAFIESAPDVVNHGINGGFSGWIYYTETTAFARKNRAAITELAEELASDFGMGTLEMVQGFNCLGKEDYSTNEIGRALYGRGDDTQILNALAWFAAEEVCREWRDMNDSE